jgi:hypothetical protein
MSDSESSSSSEASSSAEDIDNRGPSTGNAEGEDTSNLEPYRLATVAEASNEDLMTSGMSLMSDRSDVSMYRAGVEALVKEACPDELDNIDEMMIEYEGREEVLIGKLSIMLAAKNRSSSDFGESQPTMDASDRSGEDRGDSFSSSSTASNGRVNEKRGNSLEKDDEEEGDGGANDAGSASAVVAAAAFAAATPRRNSIDSSSVGSSDWSTSDGLSSVDASNETSESSLNETPASTLAAIGAASAITSKIGVKEEQSDSGKMFAPVGDAAAHSRDDGSISSKSDVDDQPVVTREDLDAAIQAGDWSAVSNTARLLANADPSATDLDNMSSSFKSQDSSLSGLSHGDVDRASEFSKLVEEGDWEGIMAAAAQFEGASDSESFASRRSMMSDSSVDSEFEPKTANDNTDKSKLRAEVESLVRTVVPDEIGKWIRVFGSQCIALYLYLYSRPFSFV